jgi:hypothetical protein
MVTVDKIDINSKSQVNDFVMFHYKLYKNCPQWVPPFIDDIKTMMNPNKHPFYEHSDAEFFVARHNGEIVGRIAAMEIKPYNKYHETRQSVFNLFDTIDDEEVTNALFERVFDWSRKRGLDTLVGPKGFTAFDGYGIQIEGHDHRQMMIMMNYNYPYYQKLVENLGFEKEVDFVSCYLPTEKLILPERVHEIARRVQERGKFKVIKFKNKKDMLTWADPLGEAYNQTFVKNWEYYPLSKHEIDFMVKNLMTFLDYRLLKLITYNDKIIGFLIAFPDISAALQRQGGKVTPWGILDYLIDLKRTDWISLNGMGILPEYQGLGGNALLYTEMEKTALGFNQFKYAELTNVAETTKQMRADLKNVGGEEYKNHRVYHRKV